MSLNFPDNPTVGDIYTDTGSGFSYEWDGTVWKSYTPSNANNIGILDDISSSFDGIQDTFALTISSTAVTPANSQQLRIVLGGVVQNPGVDYTTTGSNITFTTPPAGGLSFSGVSLGPAVAVNVFGDGTVTPAKLSTGGPVWNSSGDVYISGITTINDKVKVGVGTTALIVEGDARITGILTAISFFGDGSGLSGVSAGSTVFNDNSTNQDYYPLFTDITTGTITASGISTSKLTYNPSTGAMTAVDFNSTSDQNLKENIQTIENSLEIVSQLRGVSFDWKENGKSSYGVIAQELEEVLPELVKQGEIKSVNYNGLVGILIEAIKELKVEINELKK